MTTRTVSLSVDVEDDSILPRVMEVMARCMSGLVMEGIDARVFAYTTEEETEE